jgi:hypothetical protein
VAVPAAPAAPPSDANDVARDAQALAGKIRATNAKLKTLGDQLGAAYSQMAGSRYPAELAATLEGGATTPAHADLLDGSALRLPAPLARALIHYIVGVAELEKTTTSLRGLLPMVRPPLEKAWREKDAPVVAFSVIFRKDGPKGTIADLVPNKEPFPLGASWPGQYPVLVREARGLTEKKATRWTKGPLTGADPIAVPVDPASTAGFTGEVIQGRLMKALFDTGRLINGDVDEATPGLLAEGEALARELTKIAGR